jgi:hypothetical protein
MVEEVRQGRRLRDDTVLPPLEQRSGLTAYAILSAQQIEAMSVAIETVLYHLDGENDRKLRGVVTRVVLAIAKFWRFRCEHADHSRHRDTRRTRAKERLAGAVRMTLGRRHGEQIGATQQSSRLLVGPPARCPPVR